MAPLPKTQPYTGANAGASYEAKVTLNRLQAHYDSVAHHVALLRAEMADRGFCACALEQFDDHALHFVTALEAGVLRPAREVVYPGLVALPVRFDA